MSCRRGTLTDTGECTPRSPKKEAPRRALDEPAGQPEWGQKGPAFTQPPSSAKVPPLLTGSFFAAVPGGAGWLGRNGTADKRRVVASDRLLDHKSARAEL